MGIFYLAFLGCVIYLVYMIVMQTTQAKKRNLIIAQAQQEFDIANSEFLSTKKELLESVSNIYGQEKADKVKNGIIWIGMPMHLLLISWGKANDIKESLYKGKSTEKWYYGEYLTRLNTTKYKQEVILENGEVVGWKDLA